MIRKALVVLMFLSGSYAMAEDMAKELGKDMHEGMGMDGMKKMESMDHSGGKAALMGYCPVALLDMHKAMQGNEKFASTFKGTTYYCSSADAKAMFDKNPKKYVNGIGFGGNCVVDLAKGHLVPGDPSQVSMYKGKAYLTCNAEEKAAFEKDPKGLIAEAKKNLKTAKKM